MESPVFGVAESMLAGFGSARLSRALSWRASQAESS